MKISMPLYFVLLLAIFPAGSSMGQAGMEMGIPEIMPGSAERFYANVLDHKIHELDMQASGTNGAAPLSRCSLTTARARADFYRSHRASLIQEMVRRDFGFHESRIDSFLNQSFVATQRNPAAGC